MANVIEPITVVNIIKSLYPGEEVTITDHGLVPGMEDANVKRYQITFNVFGARVQINIGENLVLLINGVPRESIRYLQLADGASATAKLENWLRVIRQYLEAKELPLVKALARTYLGEEENVNQSRIYIGITYDKFIVIISPDSAALLLKTTRRIVYFAKFTNNLELEQFFESARYHAAAIREGKIA